MDTGTDWRFVWYDDWMVGDHQKEYDCYEDGNPETCEQVILYDGTGNVLAALGCIDDATDEYRREIESELLEEAWGEVRAHEARAWRAGNACSFHASQLAGA